MAESKLLAEWFLTDRWMGSSAFLLPMEQQGLYRAMLTQAWRRGAKLPNDPEAIKRAVGCTDAEWARCWPKIERYWRVVGDTLVNDTQVEVYAESRARHVSASVRGKKGAQVREAKRSSATSSARSRASSQDHLKIKPPSPSPSPSVSTSPDNGNESPPAADIPPPPWSREAADDWKAAKGGAAPKSIFAPLQGAVRAHGWDRVRPVWRWYLHATAADYVSVPKFVSAFGEYEERSRGQPAPGGAKQTVGDRAMENARKFIEGGKT